MSDERWALSPFESLERGNYESSFVPSEVHPNDSSERSPVVRSPSPSMHAPSQPRTENLRASPNHGGSIDENSRTLSRFHKAARRAGSFKRLPSASENEVRDLIFKNGPHTAISLRERYHQAGHGAAAEQQFHTISFNFREAAKSFLYELCPSPFLSTLSCLLLEPSLEAGFNVARHRDFFPWFSSDFGSHWGSVLFSGLVQSFILGCLLYRFTLTDEESQIDIMEMVLSYSWLVARYAAIGVKYGYFPPLILESMRHAPPVWTNNRTRQRLLIASWLEPRSETIKDALLKAAHEANCDLEPLSFDVTPECANFLRRKHYIFGGDVETANLQGLGSRAAPAAAVFHFLTFSCFREPVPASDVRKFLCLTLLICLLPGLLRLCFGLAMFGTTPTDKVIFAAMFLATFTGCAPIMLYGVTSRMDLARRTRAMELLGAITEYPGIPIEPTERALEELWEDPSPGETSADPVYLFIDLQHGSNAFTWMLMRRSMRFFEAEIHRRGLAYTGVLFSWAILAQIALNAILFLQMKHHMASLGVIAIGIVGVSVITVRCMAQAQALQKAEDEHRFVIMRTLLSVSEELVQYAEVGLSLTREALRLKRVRDMLKLIEETIAYEDQVHDPIDIFGIPAGPGMLSAVLGILSAGFLFAVEQLSGTTLLEGYSKDGDYLDFQA